MNIFITGATGFVGRNFLEFVVNNHPEVQITCLVRDPEKARLQWEHRPQFGNGQIQWIQGDLLNPESYKVATQQADYVFHIAALVSLRNGPEFYQMNTDTTKALLLTLKDNSNLKRLVFISSISAIDRPINETAVGPLTEETPAHPNTDYGKSKLQAESLIQESGLPYTILRPPYIYGPYPRMNSSIHRLVTHVRDQAHYTQFPFSGRASEIYVEDLAEMIWVAAEHPATRNEVFFVSNPEPASMANVLRELSQALNLPYQAMSKSPEQIERYKRRFYQREPENVLLRVMFEDFFYCSPEKWYRLTQFKPRYGYQKGLAKTIQCFKENGMV